MTAGLIRALTALLAEELPGLFGGDDPTVRATVTAEGFTAVSGPADGEAGRPRPDDQLDELPFDPAQPAGPYVLTRAPQPGPRRIRLLTALGDRIPLTPAEVLVDPVDSRTFTLAPRPDRDVTAVTAVQAQYSVVAVYATLRFREELGLILAAPQAATLDSAEALAVAVLTLNRERLAAAATETVSGDGYTAHLEITEVRLSAGAPPTPGARRLVLLAEVVLKASRTLASDEGSPIVRIGTASTSPDPARPVDIRIDVEA